MPAECRAFQQAYDFFNVELFGASLPHVVVSFRRHAKACGYFHRSASRPPPNDSKTHELAMNPDTFTGRKDEEILSTFACLAADPRHSASQVLP